MMEQDPRRARPDGDLMDVRPGLDVAAIRRVVVAGLLAWVAIISAVLALLDWLRP